MKVCDITKLAGTLDRDTGQLLCLVKGIYVRGYWIPVQLTYSKPKNPELFEQHDHSRLKRAVDPTLN